MSQLVSCSKIVTVHDISNPKPKILFQPTDSTINCSTWSHNNTVLASCANNGKIILNNAQNAAQLLEFEDIDNPSIPINSIKMTSGSQMIASGCNDGKIRIYSLQEKKLIKTISSHFGGVMSVDWSRDNSLLASASLDGEVNIQRINQDYPICNFASKESQGTKMIKFSPFFDNLIAQAQNNGYIKIWDLEKRKEKCIFESAHNSRVSAVCFSSENQNLMCSAGLDRQITFYDLSQNKIIKRLECSEPLTAMSFCTDGLTIACGTLYGKVLVYNLKNDAKLQQQLEGHEEGQSINFIQFQNKFDIQNKPPAPKPAMAQQQQQQQQYIQQQQSKLHTANSLSSSSSKTDLKQSGVQSQSPMVQNRFKSDMSPIPQNIPSSQTSFLNNSSISYQTQQQTDIKSNSQGFNMSKHNSNRKEFQIDNDNIQKQDFYKKSLSSNINTTNTLINKNNLNANSYTSNLNNITYNNNNLPNFQENANNSLKYSNSKGNLGQNSNSKFPNQNSLNKSSIIQTAKYNTNNNNNFNKKNETLNDDQLNIKQMFEDQKQEIKMLIQDEMSNLNMDIIKQFQIQQMETEELFQKYLLKQNQLENRIKQLEEENQKLKKISY